MAFFEPTFETFGLDISDQSVKVAAIERKRHGGLKLVSFGEETIPEGAIERGEIKNTSQIARAVRAAMRGVIGKSLKGKYAVAALPEEKSFVRIIQLPPMKEAELAAAVPWELEANIPLPFDQVYYDWQNVTKKAKTLDHYDIMISASPHGVVKNYLAILKGAGVTPFALEVESAALSRALLKGGISPQPVLIIDFGAHRTSFIIFSGEAIRFTSSTTFSSAQMTQQISKDFSIPFMEAEKIKRSVGLDKKRMKGRVFRISSDILNRIVGYAQTHIAYYRDHAAHEHSEHPEIAEIILCGGAANLIGLDAFLNIELKLPVRRGNPWINILKPPLREIPLLPYKRSLSYTTALGLALRSAGEKDVAR